MNDPMRICVLGCGAISARWFKAITTRTDARIVAVVDLRQEAAERRAAEFQLADAHIGTDLRCALRQTCPDVLVNLTIPEAHASTSIQALKHGCHVMTEKPLADTMANARRMNAVAARVGKRLAVMQNRRFTLPIRRVRQLVHSGAIGKVTMVQSNFMLGPRFGGFRDRMEHVLLLDMAIHTFDQARFLTGEDAVAVYCREWNPEGSWYDHDAAAVAVFEMSGGTVYNFFGSWCADGCRTPWDADWRILGSKGGISWDGAETITAHCGATDAEGKCRLAPLPVPDPDAVASPDGAAGAIHDFLDSLRTGTIPACPGTDNIKSLAMVHGAIESARRQRRVAVPSAGKAVS